MLPCTMLLVVVLLLLLLLLLLLQARRWSPRSPACPSRTY
jgi:hypothetical protein